MAAQGAGIGQQDRTKGTQQLWDYANASQVVNVCDSKLVLQLTQPRNTTSFALMTIEPCSTAISNVQGESLEPGVAMQKVMEEAETTLGMLAFDAFPRFLKSKFCNAVMDDLKKSSNPNEVNLV